MKRAHPTARPRGFTLVEILVVISIIALLVAIMLPAFNVVRTKARVTQTTAQISSLNQGLEMFRGESALGSVYPPSRSDNAGNHLLIANPEESASAPTQPDTKAAGAHLLLQAMVGADLLGTPGFKDLDYDGSWSDDTYAVDGSGIYAVDDDTGVPERARYGGASGYVDEKMIEYVRTLQQLKDAGAIMPNGMDPSDVPEKTAALRLFVDPWEHPILYYKANPAAQLMLGTDGDADSPGVYKQQDNGIITGSDLGQPYNANGIDFGGGELTDAGGFYHALYYAKEPEWNPATDDVLVDTAFDYSFARFIFDPTVKARNTPVRKASYLLISAGPDAVYGTTDDVVNWNRERQ